MSRKSVVLPALCAPLSHWWEVPWGYQMQHTTVSSKDCDTFQWLVGIST